jgi:hypothetical protein
VITKKAVLTSFLQLKMLYPSIETSYLAFLQSFRNHLQCMRGLYCVASENRRLAKHTEVQRRPLDTEAGEWALNTPGH